MMNRLSPFPLRCRRILPVAFLALSGCSASGEVKAPPKVPPVLVVTAKAERKSVPVRVLTQGHLEACAKVEVKSRIDGEIVEMPFAEGAEVKAGQLLYRIDDRTFSSQLAMLKANLRRDQGQLELARSQEKRRKELLRTKAASDDQYDTSKAALIVAEANVLADEAAMRNMELNLDYARIRAPISGRVGHQFLKLGSLVKANDTSPLVTIHQMDPLCLGFSVPERHLPTILEQQAKRALPVTFQIPEAGSLGVSGEVGTLGGEGRLTWIDNSVDASTGTVPLQASIPNPGGRFWPGQFVQVRLGLYDQEGAIVVPTQALQSNSKGRFLFVVKGEKEKSAELRPITVDREDEREAVIKAGVEGGEEVVVIGQWRLTNGAKVEVKPAAGKAERS
ncbi:MAG: efflux RND transporter periplasmic adaptor subunit [Magnetococcales bacterium]|nr:efflux RND transporter periplasmic adaptor subunit [Magnetococcales bacterium]